MLALVIFQWGRKGDQVLLNRFEAFKRIYLKLRPTCIGLIWKVVKKENILMIIRTIKNKRRKGSKC